MFLWHARLCPVSHAFNEFAATFRLNKCARHLSDGRSSGVKVKLPWSLVTFAGWSLMRGRLYSKDNPSVKSGEKRVVVNHGGRSRGVLYIRPNVRTVVKSLLWWTFTQTCSEYTMWNIVVLKWLQQYSLNNDPCQIFTLITVVCLFVL